MTDAVLAVDIGTTSLKAGIFSADGGAVSFCSQTFPELDGAFAALQWYPALRTAVSALLDDSPGVKIAAAGISGNGPTLVAGNGRTLLWNRKIPDMTQKYPDAGGSLFVPRILAFRDFFPDDFSSSGFVFSGPEYLIFLLTGNPVTVLPEKRFESAYWNSSVLNSCGIPPEKLPPFVGIGDCCGKLTESAAAGLGLTAGIPVFSAGPDFVAAMIGTGTLSPGKLCDCAGSSEGLNLCVTRPFSAEGVRTLPSVVPGLWNMAVLSQESGRMFVDCLVRTEKKLGRRISYGEFFSDSVSGRNPEGRQILELIMEHLRDGISVLRRNSATAGEKFPERMTVAGGQAKNPEWMQMRADLLGMEISVCNCADSELTGNLCACLAGLGLYPSVFDAASRIVRPSAVYYPPVKR